MDNLDKIKKEIEILKILILYINPTNYKNRDRKLFSKGSKGKIIPRERRCHVNTYNKDNTYDTHIQLDRSNGSLDKKVALLHDNVINPRASAEKILLRVPNKFYRRFIFFLYRYSK